jgi:four helix bundle protein
MGDFKKLAVWRKAHGLALHVHRTATRMRGPGAPALRNQMIRAAFSVPANIVEGHGQRTPAEFTRFLGYGINSASELEYHLLSGRDLAMIAQRDFDDLVSQLVEVRKMLCGLRASLSRSARGLVKVAPDSAGMGPEPSD